MTQSPRCIGAPRFLKAAARSSYTKNRYDIARLPPGADAVERGVEDTHEKV